MNNKGIGAVFCLIAAILMSARYLAAAVYMSGVSSWSDDMFAVGLSYVGAPLMIASVIAMIAGIAFLACGLYQDFKSRSSAQRTESKRRPRA